MLRIKCSECYSELDCRLDGEAVVIEIVPCARCMKREKEISFDIGYENGQEVAYKDGYDQGYRDSQETKEETKGGEK